MGAWVGLAGQVRIESLAGTADDDHLPGNQPRLAFAVLVLERQRSLGPAELAEILWPGELPETWQAGLRNVIKRVRGFLTHAGLDAAAVLRNDAGRYRLVLPAEAVVDVEQAESQVAEAAASLAAGDEVTALERAAAARSVLERPVLPAVDNPWLDRVRDRLGELGLRAAELEAEGSLRAGDHRSAVTLAEAIIDLAPLRESAHRLLMRAHAEGENRGLALRAYERCRHILADELGIDPSPETEATYLALLGTEPSTQPEAPVPPTPTATADAGGAADVGDVGDGPPDRRRPTGTVTFLFSDIEESSAHWTRDPEGMAEALQVHDDLLARAVADHGGRIFKHTGDGVAAVFAAARDALGASVTAQRHLAAAPWPTTGPLLVRIGLHTGEAQVRGDDYSGVAVNRAARVCELASGGQVLASSATRLVADGSMPPGVELHYVGDVRLKGMDELESVYHVRHPDLPADAVHLTSAARPFVAAPLDEATVVGRADELAAVAEALGEARLVSITGFGGVGKTSLALETARTTRIARPARVWWADLISTDAAGIAHELADLVGAGRSGSGPIEAAVEELERAPALVIFDNCEHVLDAARSIAGELLHRCPSLRILATSRVPLGVAGERVVSIGPLPFPAEDAALGDILASPAVEVFTRRARMASAAFRLDASNAPAVAEICRRLDGLPLAVELAAARVRSMAPAQIAAHLDQRFRLLRRSEASDGEVRHRNLEEVLTWSRQLLEEREQVVLDRLSLLAGTFDLETAVAVAGDDQMDDLDVLDVLDALVERSLVVSVHDPVQARYRMLETVRAFGRRALEDSGGLEEVTARHRAHHRSLVEAAAVGLQGPDEVAWVRTVSLAYPDIRAAFVTAARDGDVDTCQRIVVALYDYAFFRMRLDVGGWAVDAVSLPGAAEHPAFADAAAVAGFLAWQRGDVETARTWIDRAEEAGGGWLADDAAGTLAMFRGEIGEAIEHWRRAACTANAENNPHREAIALTQVAFGHVFQGDTDAAEPLARQAETIARATGNPTAQAQARWCLGVTLYDRHPDAALGELEEAMALARAVDNRMALGSAAVPADELRAKLAHRSRDADLSAAIERLDYWLTVGSTPTLWNTVRWIAHILADLGAHEPAALALSAEAAATLKLPTKERDRDRYEAVAASVRAELGGERFAELADRGAKLSIEELAGELRAAADRATSG